MFLFRLTHKDFLYLLHVAQDAKGVFILFRRVFSSGRMLAWQVSSLIFHVMGTEGTQSSRGHNEALRYANPSVSLGGIAPDVLQPVRSLPDIMALQAFGIFKSRC